jgi:hypothetical protein
LVFDFIVAGVGPVVSMAAKRCAENDYESFSLDLKAAFEESMLEKCLNGRGL